MPVVANKAKERQFSDLPVKTQQRIVDILDPISKCRLRRVSKAFSVLSNNSKIHFTTFTIEVARTKVEIIAGTCDIEYSDPFLIEDVHKFRTRKMRDQWLNSLPPSTAQPPIEPAPMAGLFMDAAATGVVNIFKSPNVSVDKLIIKCDGVRRSPLTLGTPRQVAMAFGQIGRQVAVRVIDFKFRMWNLKASEIPTVLKAMQPGTLKMIRLVGAGTVDDLYEQMVNTEQWKQANHLHVYYFTPDFLRPEQYAHFGTLQLIGGRLLLETFSDVIKNCLKNPKFCELKLIHTSAIAKENERDITSYLRRFPTKKPDTEWHYIPIPDKKKEVLKVRYKSRCLEAHREKI